MRRDSIFYQLFQQFPALLFELLDNPPDGAQSYRFDSVAVKEPKFEIDGVFLPPSTDTPGIIFFCEVQFQKDERLYERLFSEAFLYFYRQRERFSDWQAVIIYPSRNVEQTQVDPFRPLLESNKVHRVYLDELGPIEQLPLGVALMVLTRVSERDAPAIAKALLSRAQRETASPTVEHAIMSMITTIMIYKFTTLSRREVESMLGITLQQTRVYQEAKEEGRQEGWQEGRQEGRQEGERSLVLRLLTRRVGELPDSVRSPIETLSIEQLEQLGEALLDFASLADLEAWLKQL